MGDLERGFGMAAGSFEIPPRTECKGEGLMCFTHPDVILRTDRDLQTALQVDDGVVQSAYHKM